MANELITSPVGYFVKIDLGTHRTGIDPSNDELIQQLANGSSDGIQFKGFLGHAGHTYSSTNKQILEIYTHSIKHLINLKSTYGGILSYGDTPSCSLVENFDGVDEMRAGNYTFYDWMQKEIGSCSIEDIGVCLASPVVAVHKARNELVVLGGAVHLSKDLVMEQEAKCFGKAVRLLDDGWGTEIVGSVIKVSQEHGIINMSSEEIDKWKVGDLIGILPIHSCLAADLQGHYLATSGERISKIIKE